MKALAIVCRALAWFCSSFIGAAVFAALKGNRHAARIEAATGLIGAAGFAMIGAHLW